MTNTKLIVADIDNTVFDWVTYYVSSFTALLELVSKKIDIDVSVLAGEAREVFEKHGSIEYPFLIQELPSVIKHYGDDIDAMLNDCVRVGRDRFLEVAEEFLRPYPNVVQTFESLKARHGSVPIVALTDAPRYVAMWKLNKLGLLNYFDAVYGLADPRIPTCESTRRVKVDPEILLKHLKNNNFGFAGKIRILPDEYEKPGLRGFKTVLMDFELDEPVEIRKQVIWIGDNLRKDIGLGTKIGVRSLWAEYGTKVNSELMKKLATFSPLQNIHKNVSLNVNSPESPKPERALSDFSQIIECL